MSEEAEVPTATVARRVAELRARKGWSATELGDKLTEKGVPWNRFTVAGLENGKRQNVTVTELLALARVLDVAPVHLLIPVDERLYRVTPDEAPWSAGRARAWLRGERPLPGTGTDLRIFRSEVPLDELPSKRTEREFFEQLASWDAVDLNLVKRQRPELWEKSEGEEGDG